MIPIAERVREHQPDHDGGSALVWCWTLRRALHQTTGTNARPQVSLSASTRPFILVFLLWPLMPSGVSLPAPDQNIPLHQCDPLPSGVLPTFRPLDFPSLWSTACTIPQGYSWAHLLVVFFTARESICVTWPFSDNFSFSVVCSLYPSPLSDHTHHHGFPPSYPTSNFQGKVKKSLLQPWNINQPLNWNFARCNCLYPVWLSLRCETCRP